MCDTRVDSCCCFSLRTGTLILLYANLFMSVLSITSSQVQIETKQIGDKTEIHVIKEYGLGSSVVIILASLAGLYGVYKEKSMFLLGYLILHVITLFAFLVLAVLMIIALTKVTDAVFIVFLAFYLAVVLIYSYLVRVVYSYYRSLSEQILP